MFASKPGDLVFTMLLDGACQAGCYTAVLCPTTRTGIPPGFVRAIQLCHPLFVHLCITDGCCARSFPACRVDAAGTITTVAGTGQPGASGDGGPATSAQLKNPVHATFDVKGDNMYIADFGNFRCVWGTRVWSMLGADNPGVQKFCSWRQQHMTLVCVLANQTGSAVLGLYRLHNV